MHHGRPLRGIIEGNASCGAKCSLVSGFRLGICSLVTELEQPVDVGAKRMAY
jgi:hypothetical protein